MCLVFFSRPRTCERASVPRLRVQTWWEGDGASLTSWQVNIFLWRLTCRWIHALNKAWSSKSLLKSLAGLVRVYKVLRYNAEISYIMIIFFAWHYLVQIYTANVINKFSHFLTKKSMQTIIVISMNGPFRPIRVLFEQKVSCNIKHEGSLTYVKSVPREPICRISLHCTRPDR